MMNAPNPTLQQIVTVTLTEEQGDVDSFTFLPLSSRTYRVEVILLDNVHSLVLMILTNGSDQIKRQNDLRLDHGDIHEGISF